MSNTPGETEGEAAQATEVSLLTWLYTLGKAVWEAWWGGAR